MNSYYLAGLLGLVALGVIAGMCYLSSLRRSDTPSGPIHSYDIDGVIYLGPNLNGLTPAPHDVIITGRSFEEAPETIAMLRDRGITNSVYLNPCKFDEKSRTTSGEHKSKVLQQLYHDGYDIKIHWEDDPIQAAIVRELCPWLHVIEVKHNLVDKENVRHPYPGVKK